MNRFCSLVGCSVPLQQAAMSRVVTADLVAAVSNAGGLGMIAVGRSGPAALTRELAALLTRTSKPVGAGFIMPFLDREVLELANASVPVVEFFYGWPDPSVIADGVVNGWQIGSVDEAKAAVDAGCEYVIAQGFEAGGHVRGRMPLAKLLPAVREAVDVVVVGSGGIGTRADVCTAFAHGADAVRIGTRLLASTECDIHPKYLSLLIAATADDTVYTDRFDVGWPDAPVRVLDSALRAAEAPGPDPVGQLGTMNLPRFGTTPPNRSTSGQIEAMALYAGTSVGDVSARATAASIIGELMEDD